MVNEDFVIDKYNFNNNSLVHIQDDEQEIFEPEMEQVSLESPAPIASGGSDTVESTDPANNSTTEDESDDVFDDTIPDAGALDSEPNDPSFRTRARVDNGSDRALTRSLRNLVNYHVAYSIIHEPDTYQEAMYSSDAGEWKLAMREEFDSLIKYNTWILMERPPGVKTVDNEWVFKIKQEKKDAPIRYKARLVARGFTQEYGVNYFETFSPVVRFTSNRTILAIAAQKRMEIKQFDVKMAFLNGDLAETVYMQQPTGFEDGTKQICKLQKSLYGLKQSSRCWNKKFTDFIKIFGFIKSTYDPCVFISRKNRVFTILAIHVDDGIIVSENVNDINSVLTHLNKHFEVKEMNIGCFLGLEIQQNKDKSIFIHQSTYAERVLNRFDYGNCNGISTPSDHNQPLHNFEESEPSNYPYRKLIGSLMYLLLAGFWKNQLWYMNAPEREF